MSIRCALVATGLALALAGGCEPVNRGATPSATDSLWELLEPGLELGTFELPPDSDAGNDAIRVLRVDPGRFRLRLLNASATEDRRARSAKEWCAPADCVAAINASMYQADYLTSVSLMRTLDHVNNSHVSKDQTVLAFDPPEDGLPPVMLIDRECDELDAWKGRYGTLVQSIRMISCNGKNVWAPQPDRWSTAAIGLDGAGQVLLIHSRSPVSVHELIEALQRLPLDLSRAMYLEGGPEAQLYVSSAGRQVELVGRLDPGLLDANLSDLAWPVPNVLAVMRREIDPYHSE